MAKYKVCEKCEQRHSTLVRHKCPVTVAKRATKECEIVEHDIHEGEAGKDLSTDGGGADEGGDGADAPDGDEEGKGEGESKGEGGDETEGGDEGEGEGETAEAEAEGEVEVEVEVEGPAPQPPEPEAPPVAVVVTVLKFAALTADAAEAFTKVEVTYEGLLIISLKGDFMATAILPWTEFEKRSTVDGEFWAKEVIDATAREVLEKADAATDFAEVEESVA